MRSQLAQVKNECNLLTDDLQYKEGEVVNLEQELADFKNQTKAIKMNLEQEARELVFEKDELEKENQRLLEQISQVENDSISLKKKLEQKDADMRSATDSITKMQDEAQGDKTLLDKLRAELASKELSLTELETYKTEHTIEEATLSGLQEEIGLLSARLDKERVQSKSMSSEVAKWIEKKKDLDDKVRAQEKELETLRTRDADIDLLECLAKAVDESEHCEPLCQRASEIYDQERA